MKPLDRDADERFGPLGVLGPNDAGFVYSDEEDELPQEDDPSANWDILRSGEATQTWAPKGALVMNGVVISDTPAIPPDDTIEPLGPIHAEMEGMAERYAELGALHGAGGKFDAQRKVRLALAKDRARLAHSAQKVTESLLDDEAHADPVYRAYIDEATADDIEYRRLSLRMGMLKDRIQRSNALIHLSAAQARLGG